MASATCDRVGKRFADDIAINDLSIHVDGRQYLVLVDSSGCGKTTALRVLAFREEVTSGTIRIVNLMVNDAIRKARDIAIVFSPTSSTPHERV